MKGLIEGKEYYPNGNLRFEGKYVIHKGYGPNYPSGGTCYDRDGKVIADVHVSVRKSGNGYPLIKWPEGCEKIPYEERPDFPILMWSDLEPTEDDG